MCSEKISSDVTFALKMVLLALLVPAIVGCPILYILQNGLSWMVLWSIPVLAYFIPVCHYLLLLKQVVLTDQGLRIGNLTDNVLVPYSEISEAHLYQGRGCGFVTLVVRPRTGFERRIRFMPNMCYTKIADHSSVALLRDKSPETVFCKQRIWPFIFKCNKILSTTGGKTLGSGLVEGKGK